MVLLTIRSSYIFIQSCTLQEVTALLKSLFVFFFFLRYWYIESNNYLNHSTFDSDYNLGFLFSLFLFGLNFFFFFLTGFVCKPWDFLTGLSEL